MVATVVAAADAASLALEKGTSLDK